MATLRISGRKAAPVIANRKDFKTSGALSGRNVPQGERVYVGQLPLEHAQGLALAVEAGNVYIVFSYQTPIAWYSYADEKWTRPEVKYSMTTSHHQGVCPRTPKVCA